jgi:hypothetical protein
MQGDACTRAKSWCWDRQKQGHGDGVAAFSCTRFATPRSTAFLLYTHALINVSDCKASTQTGCYEPGRPRNRRCLWQHHPSR